MPIILPRFAFYSKYAGLAFFFLLQALPRGMMLSIIPLQALELLGSPRDASALLFIVAVGGIIAALVQPLVIKLVGVYRAFLFSCAAMIASAALMSLDQVTIFSIGLFCHAFSIASAEVVLSLLVLTKIPRNELTGFEPLRIVFTVVALTIGPFLGVYLERNVAHALPFILCALCTLVSLGCFHRLGLRHLPFRAPTSAGVNPFNHLARYCKQPRLVLAYSLTMARSCWWTMFVIYTPIYATASGLGELTGAALVSIGTAWTLSVPLWGWVARRYGVRKVLALGYATTGLFSLCVYGLAAMPLTASVLLVMSALGATMLDGVGNVLFFRVVRAHEQAAMSAIFVTYRDTGQILTPGLFAVLLHYFALPMVFATAALWMFTATGFCRHIPARLR